LTSKVQGLPAAATISGSQFESSEKHADMLIIPHSAFRKKSVFLPPYVSLEYAAICPLQWESI
jgi:hypothetical protein